MRVLTTNFKIFTIIIKCIYLIYLSNKKEEDLPRSKGKFYESYVDQSLIKKYRITREGETKK